jgi:alkaline phosphatase
VREGEDKNGSGGGSGGGGGGIDNSSSSITTISNNSSSSKKGKNKIFLLGDGDIAAKMNVTQKEAERKLRYKNFTTEIQQM